MAGALRIVVGVLVAWVALALLVDAYVGLRQPEVGGAECVLHTRDASGRVHATRLALVEDGGTLWVQSGHHFRGWYERILANPEVEATVDGETRPYTAVALDDAATREHVVGLLRERGSAARFWLIRSLLLFAEIKPVRLDPR